MTLFLLCNGEEKVPTERFLYKKDVNLDESSVFEAYILRQPFHYVKKSANKYEKSFKETMVLGKGKKEPKQDADVQRGKPLYP